MITIILLAVVGAVVAAVVGTIWYSPGTPMGRIHMQSIGFDKLTDEEKKRKMEEAKPMMFKMYAAQLILSFLTAFAVSLVVVMGVRNGLSLSYALGFVVFNWLCFIVPTIGQALLWSNCDRKIIWKKFFSEISSNLVTVILVALLASFFA